MLLIKYFNLLFINEVIVLTIFPFNKTQILMSVKGGGRCSWIYQR